MITIVQGDDTAANNKTIRLQCPSMVIGDGYTIGFVFQGITKTGAYTPGGHIDFDYTRAQTAEFPLGISYGKMYLEKDSMQQTINNIIPVCVTDSVERASGQTNDVNLNVVVNTGVPHVDKDALTTASTGADIKALANALLAAINGTNTVTGATGESEDVSATGESAATGEAAS